MLRSHFGSSNSRRLSSRASAWLLQLLLLVAPAGSMGSLCCRRDCEGPVPKAPRYINGVPYNSDGNRSKITPDEMLIAQAIAAVEADESSWRCCRRRKAA